MTTVPPSRPAKSRGYSLFSIVLTALLCLMGGLIAGVALASIFSKEAKLKKIIQQKVEQLAGEQLRYTTEIDDLKRESEKNPTENEKGVWERTYPIKRPRHYSYQQHPKLRIFKAIHKHGQLVVAHESVLLDADGRETFWKTVEDVAKQFNDAWLPDFKTLRSKWEGRSPTRFKWGFFTPELTIRHPTDNKMKAGILTKSYGVYVPKDPTVKGNEIVVMFNRDHERHIDTLMPWGIRNVAEAGGGDDTMTRKRVGADIVYSLDRFVVRAHEAESSDTGYPLYFTLVSDAEPKNVIRLMKSLRRVSDKIDTLWVTQALARHLKKPSDGDITRTFDSPHGPVRIRVTNLSGLPMIVIHRDVYPSLAVKKK